MAFRRSPFQINAIGRLRDGPMLDLIQAYACRGIEPTFHEYVYNNKAAGVGIGAVEKIKEGEAELLLGDIPSRSYIIALDPNGETMTSERFADFLDTKFLDGYSHIVFIIGGAYGLHKSVLEKSNKKLSLSKMTFPHMLARVILMEQLYRASEIWRNSPYHK